jgi:endoglucanase
VSPYPARRVRPAVAAGAALILALGACGGEPPQPTRTDPGGAPPPPPPPVFYVDPENPASEQARRWATEGRTAEAEALNRIGTQPTARWLTGEADDRATVETYLEQATISGQTPVIVLHNLPERDCGRGESGGAATDTDYQRWIRDVAAAFVGHPAIVVLEPGGVPDAVGGCLRAPDRRLALLRDAVAVLSSTKGARIYLDAGHPTWITDVPRLAAALRRSGIGQATGFALNVAGFVDTEENIRYGHRLADALGGDRTFVIDTSRNGNGAYPGPTVAGGPAWCNPPDRALGPAPTDKPGTAGVDALLWIKFPGESDGACRPGEPASGEWWPEYALGLTGFSG